MNIKHILAISAVAFATSNSFAFEPTQFNDLGGQQSRAEVKAELAQAQAERHFGPPSELYGSFDAIASGERSRDSVRAEARAAAQSNGFSMLYDGE